MSSGRKITAEHKFNIVLLGPLGVGKSALTVKYITKRFIMDYDPFIEGTYSKVVSIDGQDALVKIRDTYMPADAGRLTTQDYGWDFDKYAKWADGFLLVFSVTCQDSFEQARLLLDMLVQYVRTRTAEYPILLVGNKSDLESCRAVSESEGAALAAQFDCKYCETSAAEDYENVEHAFTALIHEIQRERDAASGDLMMSLFISEDSNKNALALPQGGSAGPKSGAQIKRVKSGKPLDQSTKRLTSADAKKPPGGFKIFNKSFKIFN